MFVPTPRPSEETVWTTRQGEELTMREISNEHLRSIIRLLERRRDEDAPDLAWAYDDKIEEFRDEARRRNMRGFVDA